MKSVFYHLNKANHQMINIHIEKWHQQKNKNDYEEKEKTILQRGGMESYHRTRVFMRTQSTNYTPGRVATQVS